MIFRLEKDDIYQINLIIPGVFDGIGNGTYEFSISPGPYSQNIRSQFAKVAIVAGGGGGPHV